MRPELDETLAAGVASPDPMRTATAPRIAADPTTALAEGQQLGHFRIERPLGAGGMGEVYLATDLALDRPVAIKVLPAAVARDPVRRDRMIREARAQARITHPNIGHIYFIGEEVGRLYFAMEYVAGETLAALLAKGPIPVDDALAMIRSAALGLREAQRNGITHRDIKPSNLMLDGHGMIKVLDFGLAASTSGAAGALPGTAPVAQTSLAGTPLYMAPEQARGEPVNFQSDIYALGATLYHLVSGRPPFEADSLDALMSKHASAERPSVPRRAGLPRTTIAAIDALCNRMMAPAPTDRFASYDELIHAIELASVEHARPAGFWVRSIATLIDLLVASIVGLVIYGLIHLALQRGGNGSLNGLVFPAYALAATLLLVRYGRTPGQSLFELEVVDAATGDKPRPAQAAIRVVLPIALPGLGSLLDVVLRLNGSRLPGAVKDVLDLFILAAPIGLLWASLGSLSKRTVWDRLSGTLVRYRTRRPTTR